MPPRLALCHAISQELATAAAPLPEKKRQSSDAKEMAEANQQLQVTEIQAKATEHACGPLTSALEQRGKGWVENFDLGDMQSAAQIASAPTLTRWSFDNGVLVQIKVTVQRATYDQVREDMTTRTGVKPADGAKSYQNGFGATWTDPHADWLTSEIHAHLEQINDPARPDLSLFVQSRAEFDAQIRSLQHQASPLD